MSLLFMAFFLNLFLIRGIFLVQVFLFPPAQYPPDNNTATAEEGKTMSLTPAAKVSLVPSSVIEEILQ